MSLQFDPFRHIVVNEEKCVFRDLLRKFPQKIPRERGILNHDRYDNILKKYEITQIAGARSLIYWAIFVITVQWLNSQYSSCVQVGWKTVANKETVCS